MKSVAICQCCFSVCDDSEDIVFRAELGTCGYFQPFLSEKCYFLHLLMNEFVGYFNRNGPEIGYFYHEIGLEETFGSTLQNRKPQIPSTGTSEKYHAYAKEGRNYILDEE